MRSPSSFRNRAWLVALCAALVGLVWSAPAEPQNAPFPLQPGEAVATCFSGYNDPFDPTSGIKASPVVAAVDVRAPLDNGAVPGKHWLAPMYHNETTLSPTADPAHEWNSQNLGQVFGVALDDAGPPSIFVTAASVYTLVLQPDGSFADRMFGPLGPGGIYRLDGATGAICPFAQLPNSGPALGNVAHDRENGQIFVSNFEDGLIYRLPASSPCGMPVQVLGAFDHGLDGLPAEGRAPIADDGLAFDPANAPLGFSCTAPGQSGFTPLGRRPWGLQVFEGRLYYAVWNEDQGRGSAQVANEVWSVAILPGGGFDLADVRLEVDLPPIGSSQRSNPVSDIAFSGDGRMLVAERVRCRDFGIEGTNAHNTRVLEYQRDANGTLQLAGRIAVGRFSINDNSAGGVDYGFDYRDLDGDGVSESEPCDETYWATGDALRLGLPDPPRAVYGLQGTPRGVYADDLAQLAASFFIDLNPPNFTTGEKTEIGDVEVARTACVAPPCLDEVTIEALCAVDDSGQASGEFTWRFRVTNRTDGPIHHLFLVDLPPGVTADPAHVALVPPIPKNGSRIVGPITFEGAAPGQVLGLRVTIHDERLVECCAERVTVELPGCECAQLVTERTPPCFELPGFVTPPPYRYRFALQNLTSTPVEYVLVHPVDPNDLTSPLPPDDLEVSVPGALGSALGAGGVSDLLTVLVDGPGATPGRRVCLRISSHDPAFRECCSIVRCFTLPDCTIQEPGPDDFTVFGDALLGFEGGRIVISGFGEGGEDGVAFDGGGADGFVIGFEPLEGFEVEPAGAVLELAATGPAGDAEPALLGAVRIADFGRDYSLAFDAGARRLRVELLRGGEVVRAGEAAAGRPLATLAGWPATVAWTSEGGLGIIIVGREDTYAHLAGAPGVTGDAVRVRPVGGPAPPVARVRLTAEGLEQVRIRTLQRLGGCGGGNEDGPGGCLAPRFELLLD